MKLSSPHSTAFFLNSLESEGKHYVRACYEIFEKGNWDEYNFVVNLGWKLMGNNPLEESSKYFKKYF